MKFMVQYPLLCGPDDDSRWIDPDHIAEFARVAEEAGADGIALTDHPAPSKKWYDRGGHATIDPFVGLGFIAAATSRVRLMTTLTVVPYRNPLLMAKSMTALDVVSKGRATFVLGTGYLRSEFAALGVDFEERNALFDEAVEVMKGVWSDDEFRYAGRHFDALGVIMRPGPVQRPHPPLWLGGNAKVVRRRVAEWGDGWMPMLGGPQLTATTRTAEIATLDDLAEHVREIKGWMADAGRDPSTLDVSAAEGTRFFAGASVQEQVDQLGRLGEMGITWTGFPFPHDGFDAALDGVRRYGEEVVTQLR